MAGIPSHGGRKLERRNRYLHFYSWTPVPDPDWRHRCRCGHIHIRRADDLALSTLEWVVTSEATDDYPETGYYRCAICGERYPANVGTKPPPPEGFYVFAGADFFLDGEPVTEEEYERAYREWEGSRAGSASPTSQSGRRGIE
jgi:hypothetical protein